MGGGMRIGSICTGTGALDAAVEAVLPGSRTVWHCEFADGPAAILAHRFPGVPNHRDITQVDWSQVEPVDIVTAGFPCQDVSQAGARAGLKHGTRTGIFHSVMVAVEALSPRLVFLENVLGLLTADGDEWPDHVTALWEVAQKWGRVVSLIDHKIRKARRKGVCRGEWEHRKRYERVRAVRSRKRAVAEFDRERLRSVPRAIATVLGALAAAGYDTQWCCLRASDVGAPHQRERVFLVSLPTPRVSDTNGAGSHGEGGPDLRTVAALLPTPDASMGNGGRTRSAEALARGDHQANLNDLPRMLPTPTSRDHKGHNQRGETCLTGALLPTPVVTDAKGARNATAGRAEGSQHHSGSTLTDAMTLLPTPRVAAGRTGASAATRRDSRSAPSLEQALEIARGELPREFEEGTDLPARRGRVWRCCRRRQT